MALCWVAASFVETEKNLRRVMGYQQLWVLKATLDKPRETDEANQTLAQTKKAD